MLILSCAVSRGSNRWLLSALGLACLLALAGCRQGTDNTVASSQASPSPQAAPANPQPVPSPAPSETPQTPHVTSAVVMDQVKTMLQTSRRRRHNPFPRGTELLGAQVAPGGIVTLNFNKAFGGLDSMGESNEGRAQKRLLTTLAALPGVEKAIVTVEGQPYQSQANDWGQPTPVRGEGGESAGEISNAGTTSNASEMDGSRP